MEFTVDILWRWTLQSVWAQDVEMSRESTTRNSLKDRHVINTSHQATHLQSSQCILLKLIQAQLKGGDFGVHVHVYETGSTMSRWWCIIIQWRDGRVATGTSCYVHDDVRWVHEAILESCIPRHVCHSIPFMTKNLLRTIHLTIYIFWVWDFFIGPACSTVHSVHPASCPTWPAKRGNLAVSGARQHSACVFAGGNLAQHLFSTKRWPNKNSINSHDWWN